MSSWKWPVANDPPTSGDYVARHPTRYNWLPERPDVEEWARYLWDEYGVWCNTYYDHPEGYFRDKDSLDVWGAGGRGDPIDPSKGDTIFNLLWNGGVKIEWIIWRATIYGAWNGWAGESFGEDDFSWHYDHIHVTYTPKASGGTTPPEKVSKGALAKAINPYLAYQGHVIVEEAQRAGLEVALACALVEQESNGRNIFGCDSGGPYCNEEVTYERVQYLRDGGNYGHGMQGVGLTQLTWWEFVEEAEALGGAHKPQNQCRVGFELLKRYVDTYPYLEALGAYNAGEGNRWLGVSNGYAAAVAAKHEGWRSYLSKIDEEEPDPKPNPEPEPGEKAMWEKYGWYEFASDTSWDLKFHPPEGGSTPIPEPPKPTTFKARVRDPEVEYYVDGNDYVVFIDNEETVMDKESFQKLYEEVS